LHALNKFVTDTDWEVLTTKAKQRFEDTENKTKIYNKMRRP